MKADAKETYRNARRLIRDNGRSAYRWLGDFGEALQNLANEQDHLQERADIIAWCKREGIVTNVRCTQPLKQLRKYYESRP